MPVHPWKAEDPSDVICEPSVNDEEKPVQFAKAEEPMDLMPERGGEERDEHP